MGMDLTGMSSVWVNIICIKFQMLNKPMRLLRVLHGNNLNVFHRNSTSLWAFVLIANWCSIVILLHNKIKIKFFLKTIDFTTKIFSCNIAKTKLKFGRQNSRVEKKAWKLSQWALYLCAVKVFFWWGMFEGMKPSKPSIWGKIKSLKSPSQ